ncbi:MAG TPA: hypothetical protein VK190_03545 [Pseudoneobacillus sp.]|nr:hypothetical protein [Pseudoneobacillus sp.]
MKNIFQYLAQFKPSLNRDDAKYYSEMQVLAYNLVKYLKMNNAPGEDSCQGNYNMTYLEENMSKEDLKFVVDKMLRRIPIREVKEMMYAGWDKQTTDIIFSGLTDCSTQELLDELKKRGDILFTRIFAGKQQVFTFVVDKKEE